MAVLLATITWALIRIFNDDYHVFLVGVTYQDQGYLAGFVLLAAAVLLAVQFWVRRHANRLELAVGAAMAWWLPAVVVAFLVPTFSPLFSWPLAASLVVMGVMVAKPDVTDRPWVRTGGFSVVAVTVAVLLHPAVLLFQTLSGRMEAITGIPFVGIPVLIAALALVPLLPFAPFPESRARWWGPGVAALAAVAIFGWNNATSGFDADHPKPNMVMYSLNTDSGTAEWLSVGDGALGRGRGGLVDEWTHQFLGDDPEPISVAGFSAGPDFTGPGYRAEAPVANLPAPQTNLVSNEVTDGTRDVVLEFSFPRGATNIRVFIDQPLSAMTIDGNAADVGELDQSGGIWFHYLSLPREGITVTMTVDSTEPLTLAVDDWSQGLPELDEFSYEPRPDHMFASAHDLADTTMVEATYVLE